MYGRDFFLSSTALMQAPDSAPAGGSAPSSSPAPASSSPSSSEATPTPAASANPAAEPSFDGLGSDDFESVEIPSEAPTEASPTEPSATPTEPQQTPAPPQEAVPAKPAAPAEVAPAATPPKDSSPQSEVDGLLQGLADESGKQMVDWLAQNAYKLSKEEADALELNAVDVIPKLMAKVQVQAMRNTLNLFKTMLPKLISDQVQTTTTRASRAKEAVDEFFSTNKDLNPKDHTAAMQKWAKVFRAQNPSASRADAIKFVGTAIRAELGLAPPAPTAPQAQSRPAPFAPARAGGPQQVAQKTIENPFEGLGLDFD